MTDREPHPGDHWRIGNLFNSCWRTARRTRRLMAHAVHRAEQAVGRARDHALALGQLPMLLQRLRVTAGEVDQFLMAQARAGVQHRGFDEATRRAAKVIAASTRIEYAATSSLERTTNPRNRSITTSVEIEATTLLDELSSLTRRLSPTGDSPSRPAH
ncbi:MAG TPA: hypothetical protein VHY77_01660, partial [Acidimicrobiales bacterium]|nr:hypothetical protein [Acidimicrobiales bacterium]